MSGHIVYESIARTREIDDTRPTLFDGQKLWFAHTIPQRKWLVENAQLNGATIVSRDVDADIRLVDHARKNNAPGTYSYKYVEASIRKGTMEDIADHAIGVATRVSRPVGSTVTAPKSGRTPFTAEDDQLLWNWVKPFMDRGGAWKGNELFKQLEAVNSRHTYQSWRDRWIKHTQFQQRQITETIIASQPQPSQPAAGPHHRPAQASRSRRVDDDGQMQQNTKLEPARDGTFRKSNKTSTNVEVEISHTGLSQPPARRARSKQADADQALRAVTPRSRCEVEPVQGPENATGKLEVPSILQSIQSRPFSRAEYDDLLSLIERLENQDLDDYDQPWIDYAEYDGEHTAAEWKEYFFSTVLPDHCKTNGLRVSRLTPLVLENISENEKSTRDAKICGNCFTSDAEKWKRNREGGRLCYECYKLVQLHGVDRASILVATREGQSDNENTALQRPVSSRQDHDDLVVQDRSSGPADLEIRDKEASAATVILSNAAGSAHSVRGDSPREARRPTRSPSFQPTSPTTQRPPEPNISRKRKAVSMGQTQSMPQQIAHTISASSTIDADRAPASTMATEKEAMASQRPSRQKKSWLFVPENSEDDESVDEEADGNEVDASHKDTLLELPSPPGGFEAYGVEGSPEIKLEDETCLPPRHAKPKLPGLWELPVSQLVADIRPSTTDRGSQSRCASAIAPEITSHQAPPLNQEVRTTHVTIIKQENESASTENVLNDLRRPRGLFADELLNDPKDLHRRINRHGEFIDPPDGSVEQTQTGQEIQEVVEQDKTQTSQEQQPLQETAAQDHEQYQTDKARKRKREREQPEHSDETFLETPQPIKKQIKSTSTVNQPALKTTPPNSVEDWLAVQFDLYPSTTELDPILFTASEATTFDFDLATRLVRHLIAQRDDHIRSLRRSEPNKKVTSAMIAAIDLKPMIPKDWPGVWPKEDDADLLSTDSAKHDRMRTKHGRPICLARYDLLGEKAEERKAAEEQARQ